MSLSPNLDSFQQSVSNKVDQQLANLLSGNNPAPHLMAAMKYATLGGGKRIRPLLCFASAQLFDQDPLGNNAVLSAACSVELIHAYSLVHDDLPAMDDDDLRRGRPTTHIEFDEATAILAGDALQTLAFDVLSSESGIPSEIVVKSIQILAQASGHSGMAGGQMIDLEAVGNEADLQALINMHSMKTGALIRASVTLGAMAAGCSDKAHINALASYADKIGLAFQIKDDILDCTSSTEVLGKQQGADAQLGKPTYVSLLGLDGAQEKLKIAHEEAVHHMQEFEENSLLVQIADYIVSRNN